MSTWLATLSLPRVVMEMWLMTPARMMMVTHRILILSDSGWMDWMPPLHIGQIHTDLPGLSHALCVTKSNLSATQMNFITCFRDWGCS